MNAQYCRWIVVVLVHFFSAIASLKEETSSSSVADETSTRSIDESSPSSSSSAAAALEDPLRRAYSRCGSDLGAKLVTCDPDNTLRVYNLRKKLDDILWRMQTEVPCYCESIASCRRYNDFPIIQSGVNPVFVSFAGGDLPDDLESDARSISEEINRNTRRNSIDDKNVKTTTDNNNNNTNNSDTCDNRLVLIYAIDTRALYLHAGTAIDHVFDYLPIRRRRIEPKDLTQYLEEMLEMLQKKVPEAVGIRQVPTAVGGGGINRSWTTAGFEIVIGMIAAILLVAIAIAVLVSLCLTGCCCGGFGGGGMLKKSEIEVRYADELASYRRYERECKEWTKRARYLAKRRVKMLRTMQKSDWSAKVEAAKRRLMNIQQSAKPPSSSTNGDGGGGETSGAATAAPYYIVTEPSTLSRANFIQQQPNNWADMFDSGRENTGGSDNDDTIRSGDRRRIITGTPNLDNRKIVGRKRETQRCDIYIGTKE